MVAPDTFGLLASLVDTAPVGLAFYDAHMRLLGVNETLAQVNCRSVEEHIGKTIRELRPDLADQIEPMLEKVLSTGQEVQGILIREPDSGQGGGARAWLNNYLPVRDESGRPVVVTVVVLEVTALHQAAETLRRTAEFRERFLGIVAHDLRSPLTSISTGASLLLRMEGLPAGARRVARAMEGSAERMSRMIGLLRDFTHARLGSGLPVSPRWTDLSGPLSELVLESRVAHPEKRLLARYPQPLRGNWDGDRLIQAVDNLLRNAFEHGADGKPVRLFVCRRPGWIIVSVCNQNKDGPIPPDIQPSLFDPFRRLATKPAEQGEGLGLGLYIAKEIAKAHDGDISVRSAERGTRFAICLPRSDDVTESSHGS